MMTALDGIMMELQDCALPLLEGNSVIYLYKCIIIINNSQQR